MSTRQNLFLVLTLVSVLWAENKVFETHEYSIKEMGSKMGINDVIPEEWSQEEHLQEIKRKAEKVLVEKISAYLVAKGLKDDMEYVEIHHQKLVVSGTREVHEIIANYMKNPFIDPENFFFYIKVELFPLTRDQLVALKATEILKKEEQFAPDIDEFLKQDFRGIFSAGDTDKVSMEQLHEWFAKQGITAKSSPTITLPNSFANKLVMKRNKTVNYISDYSTVYIMDSEKPLFIPQTKQLNKHLNIWIIPQLKKQNNEGKIFIQFDSKDYEEPIKVIETPKGSIHKPLIYTSRVTFEVGSTKLPVSFYTLVGAAPNIYMQLIQLNPIAASENAPLLKGEVVGVVSRSAKIFSQPKKLLSQLVLDTGKMEGVKIGSIVAIMDSNDKVVANGYVAKMDEDYCIVEVDQEISPEEKQYTYTIYRTLLTK